MASWLSRFHANSPVCLRPCPLLLGRKASRLGCPGCGRRFCPGPRAERALPGGATSEYAACSVEHRVEMFAPCGPPGERSGPVICAIGGEHAGQVRQLARAAADCGAIALLFPPPGVPALCAGRFGGLHGAGQRGLALARLLYHIPQCTRDLGMANVLRLIATVPNIIGLKDSSGNKPNLAAIEPGAGAIADGLYDRQ